MSIKLQSMTDLQSTHDRDCRRAAGRVESARVQLVSELNRIAREARVAASRLDRDEPTLDGSSIRSLMDTSALADAYANMREANMMASVLADFADDPNDGPRFIPA